MEDRYPVEKIDTLRESTEKFPRILNHKMFQVLRGLDFIALHWTKQACRPRGYHSIPRSVNPMRHHNQAGHIMPIKSHEQLAQPDFQTFLRP